MKTVDVIINGGGIVGAAMACALAPMNLSIVILDAKPKNSANNTLLVSAITYGCQQWFNALGIWNLIPSKEIGVFRSMKVWEQTEKHPAEINFDSAYLGIPALAYVVPNYLLQQALLEKLATFENVKILQSAQASALKITKENVYLTVNQQEFSAKLLIGADGANSWVREQCQFPLTEKSYLHSALITNIEIEKPHLQCAYQRFHQDNIFGILPFADSHHCGLVWSGKPETIQKLSQLSTEEFDQQLQTLFGDVLGKLKTISTRSAVPLTMRHTEKYVQPRVALIGDAAHTIHPLAGQGLNLGLWDAQQLAEIIQQTQKKNRDIGLYANLRPYERARHPHNQLLLNFVECNKILFSKTNPTINLIKQITLKTLEKLPPLKQKIMQTAVFGNILLVNKDAAQ